LKTDTDGPTIIFYTALTNLQTLVIHSTPWRSGGFLSQKFNRSAALEPTTKLSYEALHPPLRQTAVIASGSCQFSVVDLSLE